MKEILMSINPKWVEKILSGEKTVEIRKTKPKCKLPIDIYIYATKPVGKVVAKFTLKMVEIILPIGDDYFERVEQFYNSNLGYILSKSCLTINELTAYSAGKELYAWNISDLVVFKKPLYFLKISALAEFGGVTSAPQSWQYVEVEE